jgi:hypothetical protein
MRVFDRVDPSNLDRRELQMWILALSVILILAMGVGLLMDSTVFSHPANIIGFPARAIFFGFCGLSALMVGYFVDRQVVVHHLRAEDSIFLLAAGVFGIVLPEVAARGAYKVRDRLMEGLHDAAGASNRFSFSVSVVNFPEHVATSREMERAIQYPLPLDAGSGSNLEPVTPRLEIP